MKNKELIEKAIGFLPAFERSENEQTILDLLSSFLLSNALDELSKMNLYDYVNPKDYHQVYLGIYFDHGKKVVTDSWIVVCLKENYPEELEGKIIDKKGNEITGCKFPDYLRVKPHEFESTVILNFPRIAEIAKEAKLHLKLSGEGIPVAEIGGVWFNPLFLQKLAVFAKHIGTAELKISEFAAVVESGESWGLAMQLKRENSENMKIWNV